MPQVLHAVVLTTVQQGGVLRLTEGLLGHRSSYQEGVPGAVEGLRDSLRSLSPSSACVQDCTGAAGKEAKVGVTGWPGPGNGRGAHIRACLASLWAQAQDLCGPALGLLPGDWGHRA